MSNLLIEKASFLLGRMTQYQLNEDANGKTYPVIDGNKDDNTFNRHTEAGLTERSPNNGVVSGLTLKGSGVDPGHFAVGVDEHGIAHINRGAKK